MYTLARLLQSSFFVKIVMLACATQFFIPTAHAQLLYVPVGGPPPALREVTPLAVSGAAPGPQFLPVKNVSEPLPTQAPETLGSTPWLLRYVVNPVARAATRAVLVSLTQQVVNWVSANGGSNVGFVGNFEQTLTNELDDRAGEFLQQLDYIDFCGDIGAYLKLNLRVSAGGLRQRAKCSLSAIVSNVQHFYDNFQNGGWEAFLKTNVDIQNNTAGAFLIAFDAKIATEQKRAQEFTEKYKKSAITGITLAKSAPTSCVPIGEKPPPPPSGYRRVGSQETREGAAPGYTCITTYDEQTPGTVIEQTLKDANKTGIDFGISAKDFDEAIGSIITALLQRTITAAHGIFGNSGHDYGGAAVGGKDIYNYKEISASQETVRTHADAATFTSYGAAQTIDSQTVALRKELTATPAPTPAREREIKNKTVDLLGKKGVVLDTENSINAYRQSSFTATFRSDIGTLDNQISQALNRVEPIAQGVGASPYASPTNDLKTDTLNNVSGARTQLAGTIAVVNQAISEIERAIQALNAEIAASQAELATLQPQLAALRSQLTTLQTQLSTLQGQLATLQPKLTSLQSQRDTLQAQLTDLQNQLASATSQSQATTIQQQIAALQRQISSLQGQINTTQGQIDVVQGQINATQGQIATAQGQIDATQGQVSTTQTQITTTSSRIDVLNAKIAADQANILKLIDYRATLTTGNAAANQKGILPQLQEADAKLQAEYDKMKGFFTASEIVGETGLAISVMNNANAVQTAANVAAQNVFSFLDSILGGSLTPFQPVNPPAQNPAIPPPIEEAPPPPTDNGGGE